jgi:hypothetical protein
VLLTIDELTTDPYVVIPFFLHHHSWYDVLAHIMHLQNFTEDDVVTVSRFRLVSLLVSSI